MNEQEKKALREMRSRIDEMLKPECPAEELIGSWDWLDLCRSNQTGRLELRSRHTGEVLEFEDCWSSLLVWLRDVLEAQRPRVYKTGDLLPERYLWWYASGKRWSLCEMAYDEYDGMVWLPMPPGYKEEA